MPSMREAIEKAKEHAETLKKVEAKRRVARKESKKLKKESLAQRVKRKLREIYYGPKTYLPKKSEQKTTPAVRRAKQRLREAGLTEKELERFGR